MYFADSCIHYNILHEYAIQYSRLPFSHIYRGRTNRGDRFFDRFFVLILFKKLCTIVYKIMITR